MSGARRHTAIRGLVLAIAAPGLRRVSGVRPETGARTDVDGPAADCSAADGPGTGASRRQDQDVDRRSRRHDQAPQHPRPRSLQPDQLFHRQGRAARHHLRGVPRLRGPAEQEAQDRQPAGQRRLHPDLARCAGGGAARRPRRHRRRQHHGDGRAAQTGRLHGADNFRRQGSRRPGAGFDGETRQPRRSRRPDRVRARAQHLLR